MKSVLTGYPTAPIPDAEKALFSFIEKVNAGPSRIEQPDIDRLHAAGWTDEAILDAINVCGLFNYYNRLVDGCGAHPLSERGHAASGRRIAQDGYRVPEK